MTAGWPTRGVRTLVLAAALATPALTVADPLVCAPPHRGPLYTCGKGAAASEEAVTTCEREARRRGGGQPRFRINGGPWIAYDAKAWSCVAVAPGPTRVAIENRGRKMAVLRLDTSAPCASGVFDIVGPNFYRAMNTRCARRPHQRMITP